MTDLIKKAIYGDTDAFLELMDVNSLAMYKVAKGILGNDDDVADAVQNTILTCFEKLNTLKKPRYFKTWMIRILINECNKIYKMKKYKREDSCETVGSTLVSPDKTEEQINLKFICDKLSEEDGTIILLYYMEKYTDREIGEILNMKENTVRTKRNRIKNKIKKFYEEYWRI